MIMNVRAPNMLSTEAPHMIFEAVQRIFSRDIRTSPKMETVLPLGGTVFCADCGGSMLVGSVIRCGKKISYIAINR